MFARFRALTNRLKALFLTEVGLDFEAELLTRDAERPSSGGASLPRSFTVANSLGASTDCKPRTCLPEVGEFATLPTPGRGKVRVPKGFLGKAGSNPSDGPTPD